ncbi:MAG: TIGR02147 family protein [Bacteriovoracaceae bacterium]
MEQNFLDILKAKFSERCERNVQYSLRAFARDLKISPQRLSHVMNGKIGLSTKSAGDIAIQLGLSGKEKSLFCSLVQKKHARSKIQKAEAEKKLKDLKTSYQNINLDHFKIVSDWYHFAIMELTLVKGFSSNPRLIAKSLGISEIEVKAAIERLLRLEMLAKDDAGNLKFAGQFFAEPGGIPSDAVKKFHRQLLSKASDALTLQSLEHRDFSSMVLAINEKDIPEAKKDLRDFRERFDEKYCASKNKTKVYCLGMQFFSLQEISE